MISEQVTGPVAIWVGVPAVIPVGAGFSLLSGGTVVNVPVVVPTPFGWGENAPEPSFMPEYEPVMSDLSGSRKPIDEIYQGADARVSVTLSEWDEDVLQAMLAFTKASAPGTDGGLDRGTLMQAEKRAFPLWLVYPFAIKPFYVAANMRKGYHFYGTYLKGEVRRSQGTKFNRVLLNWYCGTPIVNGTFKSYDNDMSAVLGKPMNLNR